MVIQAVEVGPVNGQEGPCLLLLTHVSLDPRAFNEWLYRVELDWVVQRVWWLPAAYPATPLPAAAEGTGGADGATAAAALPYITYRGPEALKEAVRAAVAAAAFCSGGGAASDSDGGDNDGVGVRLQVYPRTMETPMAVRRRRVDCVTHTSRTGTGSASGSLLKQPLTSHTYTHIHHNLNP